MAKQISSLSILLTASVSPFATAFNTAASVAKKTCSSVVSSVDSIGSKIASLTGISAGIGGALAAIGGTAALFELGKNALETVDATSKLSDRLGISTEAMTGFQHAASQAGINSEQLTGGLEKLLKNIGEAKAKGGDAAAVFQRLGISVDGIANAKPEDALNSVADALGKIENPAQRAYAATQLFGKSGQDLLPLMMKGAAGIKEAAAQADALGISFSRVDGAKVELANEAMLRVWDSIRGVATQIMIGLAPYLEQAADLFTSFGMSAVAVVRQYLPSVISVVSSVFSAAQSIIVTAWNAIYGFVAPIVSAIVDFISANFESMLTTDIGYIEALYDGISAVFGAIWTVISVIGQAIVTAWNSAMTAMGATTMTTTAQSGGFWQTLENICQTVMQGMTLALNIATWTINNFGTVISYVFVKSAADLVTFGAWVEHIIVDVIGGYLTWIGRNWQDIFTDIFNFQITIFQNMLVNAKNFAGALWNAISGKGFDFNFTSLTNGLETSLKELPNIAERHVGKLEKSLHDQSDVLGTTIGVGLSDYLSAQDKKATSHIF